MNLPHPHLYGLLGEFDSPKQLMDAAKKVREAGYRRIDAFVPFPVEGLSQAHWVSTCRSTILCPY